MVLQDMITCDTWIPPMSSETGTLIYILVYLVVLLFSQGPIFSSEVKPPGNASRDYARFTCFKAPRTRWTCWNKSENRRRICPCWAQSFRARSSRITNLMATQNLYLSLMGRRPVHWLQGWLAASLVACWCTARTPPLHPVKYGWWFWEQWLAWKNIWKKERSVERMPNKTWASLIMPSQTIPMTNNKLSKHF